MIDGFCTSTVSGRSFLTSADVSAPFSANLRSNVAVSWACLAIIRLALSSHVLRGFNDFIWHAGTR